MDKKEFQQLLYAACIASNKDLKFEDAYSKSTQAMAHYLATKERESWLESDKFTYDEFCKYIKAWSQKDIMGNEGKKCNELIWILRFQPESMMVDRMLSHLHNTGFYPCRRIYAIMVLLIDEYTKKDKVQTLYDLMKKNRWLNEKF